MAGVIETGAEEIRQLEYDMGMRLTLTVDEKRCICQCWISGKKVKDFDETEFRVPDQIDLQVYSIDP